MDFVATDDLAVYRERALAWVQANVDPSWAEEELRTGTHDTMELQRRLARDGILGAGWPHEYGGTDVDPGYARAVYRAVFQAGHLMVSWMTTTMIISTILQLGSEDQKRRFITGALRGEVMIALGYSEPDSGSDIAAAKTVATRDGDEWVISGQKMFTSGAELCSHIVLLTRTNLDVPKHKGLTMFLVPTINAGLEIQPIHTLGGQRTNATSYTNVRVPDTVRLGGVDDGWRVIRTALVYERGAGLPRNLELTVGPNLARWARQARRPDGTRVFDDTAVAERIGRMAVEAEVARVLALRMSWKVSKGELPGVEGSMHKLYSSECAQRHDRDALDILGSSGVLAAGAPDAPAGGRFEAMFRADVVGTIYGGASEIQREIIAESLGLPRNRPR